MRRPRLARRRMAATAAFLVDHVFPDDVPLRQWVLSVPHALRGLVAMRPAVLTAISRIFLQTVFAWQRAQARKTGLVRPESAAVLHQQRFGGSLNLIGVARYLA